MVKIYCIDIYIAYFIALHDNPETYDYIFVFGKQLDKRVQEKVICCCNHKLTRCIRHSNRKFDNPMYTSLQQKV